MEVDKKKTKSRKFKLFVQEVIIDSQDLNEMRTHYAHIREMRKLSKGTAKDLKPIFSKELTNLRQSCRNDYAFKGWEVTLMLGTHHVRETFVEYPNKSDIDSMRKELLNNISKLRRDRKSVHLVTKDFQGIRYVMEAPQHSVSQRIVSSGLYQSLENANADMNEEEPRRVLNTSNQVKVGPERILPGLIGGGAVFKKPNSIVNMMTPENYVQRIRRAKRPYDNANYVGVELELITKVKRQQLEQFFIDAKLAGSVYVKHDGSIRPEVGDDVPHEVTLIAKEKDIYDVINRVCEVLNSKNVGGYVNNSCGLHVHIDMRNRNPELCYTNFKNSLNILAAMVPPDRVDSDHGRTYCSLSCNSSFQAAIEDGIGNRRARYRAINAQSYTSHQTLEIRLHSGSTNAMKINNWVKLLLSITNTGAINNIVSTPEQLQELCGFDKELLDYINLRITKFKNRSLDTRKDHFETAI